MISDSWIYLQNDKLDDFGDGTKDYSQNTQIIGTCVALLGAVLILLIDV